jgi:hypothetical protein
MIVHARQPYLKATRRRTVRLGCIRPSYTMRSWSTFVRLLASVDLELTRFSPTVRLNWILAVWWVLCDSNSYIRSNIDDHLDIWASTFDLLVPYNMRIQQQAHSASTKLPASVSRIYGRMNSKAMIVKAHVSRCCFVDVTWQGNKCNTFSFAFTARLPQNMVMICCGIYTHICTQYA